MTYFEKKMSRKQELVFYQNADSFLKQKEVNSIILYNNSEDDLDCNIAKLEKIITDLYKNQKM